MVLERAQLPIAPGREAEFEAAFDEAKAVLASSAGFVSATLSRGVESPSSYLLLVEWERLEDHTEGFRGSAAFAQWRALVGPFFASPPDVEHFVQVAAVSS